MLKDMIERRRSVRAYTGAPVEAKTLEQIQAFYEAITPLYPEIRVKMEIVDRSEVRCILPWTTPQLIAMFSEDVPGAQENVGFVFQQMDLFLQSIGLGTCWLGMGKMDRKSVRGREDGLNCMMLMAFGIPRGDTLRSSKAEFRRRNLSEIADRVDERLEPARLAPSSVNSQPWYFVHEGDAIHVFCAQRGLLKAKALSDMNRMDVGIALAHLYVSNPERFHFCRGRNVCEPGGYGYIGTIEL